VSRTDAGREFHVDGAAVLKARLPKDVLLNGVCSIEEPFGGEMSCYSE